jgi:hypothetical protein
MPRSFLTELYEKYKDNKKIAFYVVYIEEAHAIDEWDIGLSVRISSHKTMKERKDAIKKMKEETEYDFPTLIDSIENKLSRSYNAWPIRFLCFHKGRMIHRPRPENCNFNIGAFESFIDEYIKTQ